MTVSSSTNRASYSGNGSLTTFAYGFKIFDQGDLTVILRAANGAETVQTITTHYTVTGVGSASGGNVVFGSAPASGVTVVILREMDLDQGLDLVPNDPFPAQSLENSLDKLTFMVQQHKEELGRTIKASRTNVLAGSEFVISAADRANKVFSFDGSGDLAITQELGTFKGNWAASTVYKVRDLVKDTSTNNIFFVNSEHTSSGAQPLTTNANSAKYDLIVDAAAATTSATAAAASETAAETAETNAETAQAASEAARDASVVAKNASVTAQGASETAQTASEAAQAAAEAVYDTFDDRYLGAKSTSGGDPTVDNDGNALIDGALFFDTTNNATKVYNLGTTSWLRTTPTSVEQTNINALSASAVIADMAILGTADVVNDMNILATADVVTDMNVLATADVVTDMNVLGTADVVNDMNVLGTAATVTAMNLLGTNAVVTDMSILGTADVVNDMNVLGTSANVTAMGLLGTSAVVTDMSILGTADVVNDMNVLGTTANVTVMNVLGTSANVTAMSTVSGISADVTAVAADATDIGTVATDLSGSDNIGTVAGSISNVNNVGGSIANVNTVATNLSSVNSFANVYRTGSSDPTTNLDEGDLFYNSTSNTLKIYTGSAWEAGVTDSSDFLRSDQADSTSYTISFTGDIEVGDQILHHGDTDTSIRFPAADTVSFETGGSERARIDSSGNFIVGKTNSLIGTAGTSIESTGKVEINAANTTPLTVSRITDEGNMISFYEGGSLRGSIGIKSDDLFITSANSGIRFDFNNTRIIPCGTSGLGSDNTDDWGDPGTRWKDGYFAGDLYVGDQIFHDGDTDTYLQFHAANQWRVVTGGVERLEVNNSRTQIDTLLTDAALGEDYDALSGTTPTADVDAGGAFSLTMTGNTTFTFGSPSLGSGVSTGFILQLTGNGGTVTWPSSVKWAGGTAPDAPASGASNLYVFYTRDGGSNWNGVLSSAAYA